MPNTAIVSATSGELSPLIDARSDVAKYASGCRTLQNMIPRIYGAAIRRPGTEYIYTVKDSSKTVILAPFEYSATAAYVCEFGNLYVRFYIDGGILLDAPAGDPVEVTTPYLAADLFELQFKQINDVMFITHRDYPIATLSRTSATTFVYAVLQEGTTPAHEFVGGPFLEENDDTSITITPPAAATDVTTGQTFAASGESGVHTASEAFDDDKTGGDGWLVEDTTDVWIRCQLSAAKTVTRIKIWPCVNVGESNRNIRHCKIQASNNGTDWTTLSVVRWYGRCQGYNGNEIEIDKINNYTDYAEVYLDNDTAYTYYRIFAADNWGNATYSGVLEIEMMEAYSGTYTASKALFYDGHIGGLWKIRHSVANDFGGDLRAEGWTMPFFFKGSFFFSMNTNSNLVGTIAIQRSIDFGATWQVFQSWTLARDEYVSHKVYSEPLSNVMYRLAITSYTSGSALVAFSGGDGIQIGILQVTAVASTTSVTATAIEPLGSTDATFKWSEGAWSDYRGWPRTMTLGNERAVYAGSTYCPGHLWLSKVGDYYDFTEGTVDDDAFTVKIASEKRLDIQWIATRHGVAIGTSGGVWRLSGSTNSPVMTPTNYHIQEQAAIECANIQATPANDALLFVDRAARHVYELLWDDAHQEYALTPITLLCEHLTAGGITDLCFQKTPEPLVWIATGADPYLVSVTNYKAQDVMAGARHVLGGTGIVKSVCRIPSSEEDELWLLVQRTIDESTVQYIERMKPWNFGDQEDAFFVDSGLTYDSDATETITGMDHLEGEEVEILGDGVALTAADVTDGEVATGYSVEKAHLGLAYTYVYKPMRLDANILSRGSAKRISKIVPSFYETLGAKYGRDADELYDVLTQILVNKYGLTDTTIFTCLRDVLIEKYGAVAGAAQFEIDWPRTTIFEAVPLYTGDVTLVFDGGYSEKDDLIITGSGPLPCTITSLAVGFDKYDV